MTKKDHESVVDVPTSLHPSIARWFPKVGAETLSLLARLETLTQDEKDRLRDESAAILSRCPAPHDMGGHVTGLVVGYVQSGKTLSFTTVAALARDNKYPIVIVIAGTSVPLFEQSQDRLRADLGLRTRYDRQWRHFSNPELDSRDSIESTLAEWMDPSVPQEERQTLLFTVMKHHQRLANLNRLLEVLELRGVPVLVIDDEADQAGLNAAVNDPDNPMSTTYSRLLDLRARLPHHAYLQYTATPQAPLLINMIDAMSPEFAELLTPGHDYSGGERFFRDLEEHLVRTIPDSEIGTRDVPLDTPPATLLHALKVFFIGVAAGMLDRKTRNRSMMIHPSQYTNSHAEYRQWVDAAKSHWERVLRQPDDDPSKEALLAQFRLAHDDLARTASALPTFEAVKDVLRRAILKTNVETVNATGRGQRTPQIDWQGNYSWVLIGGQAMDRGFTVEGLTVTYMPRGIGVGNADTIQQRARFFGYKEAYIGYCRVYLCHEAREAYQAYVDHEDELRQQLERFRATGKPLSAWKRAFFLDQSMRPTRANVLDLDYSQGEVSDEWVAPKTPHVTPEAVASNARVVERFVASMHDRMKNDEGDARRTLAQRHRVARDVPLARVLQDLLVEIRMARLKDSVKLTGALLQVSRYLESNPDAMCTVYEMSPGEQRHRAVDDSGEVPNLFQGANPSTGPTQGAIYPGDREVRGRDGLTLQIHKLVVETPDGSVPNVYAVALFVPREMTGAWLVQHDGDNE